MAPKAPSPELPDQTVSVAGLLSFESEGTNPTFTHEGSIPLIVTVPETFGVARVMFHVTTTEESGPTTQSLL